MKQGQIWSEEYDAPVSPTFAPRRDPAPPTQIKIDIGKCEIIRNEYGYYYLYMQGKEIKRLTFSEYLKYRHYVMRVTDNSDPRIKGR